MVVDAKSEISEKPIRFKRIFAYFLLKNRSPVIHETRPYSGVENDDHQKISENGWACALKCLLTQEMWCQFRNQVKISHLCLCDRAIYGMSTSQLVNCIDTLCFGQKAFESRKNLTICFVWNNEWPYYSIEYMGRLVVVFTFHSFDLMDK